MVRVPSRFIVSAMLTPPLLWLLAGSALCLLELFLPTAFVAFMMGLSALIVACVSLGLPQVNLQIGLWMILSIAFVLLSRRLIPKGQATGIQDAKEAKTLTEIPAGEVGRVIYEGNSWQARCVDEAIAIGPNQPVIVVGRQGTTLMVMPEYLLK